ncbi:TlpA disulfide reductase family protein [Lichenihabitans sp. Uapishka_5]|uniref:TlpA family protein disulfide reductase n=1 Tax=Lichenihabitans sp. Uapishka_5 TaxID=3037302 RepID=UPI0029E7F102|nr:TlpA disulfide reductase family protein [Lichenihabitans sp. Uapishka_5]MDX7950856.1 TlpA disulfide reductase family protein [Lichenihabitans sp. Uapishka_5]
MAGTRLPGTAAAADAGEVPSFRTVRHQFVFLEPAWPMPSVLLSDAAGRPARLSAPKGRVMLVNFWASWCAACRLDLPLLERFHRVMGDRVTVAAVSMDPHPRQGMIAAYLASNGVSSLPIFLDPEGSLTAAPTSAAHPFAAATGLPVTYLVTPDGQIAGYIAGVSDWLQDDAQHLIAQFEHGA